MADIYVLFAADWMEPPGWVTATYWSRDEAVTHAKIKRNGYGDSIFLVHIPDTGCPGCGEPGRRQFGGDVSWCENPDCRVRGYETEER